MFGEREFRISPGSSFLEKSWWVQCFGFALIYILFVFGKCASLSCMSRLAYDFFGAEPGVGNYLLKSGVAFDCGAPS